ncbi:MAG: hypothetical protein ACYTFW_09930 [Planctomycetota bacterium]|jgi:hypothetical protein
MKGSIVSILIYISATSYVAATQIQTDSSLGTIEIPNGVILVVFNSNNEQITIKPTEETTQLPVGRYRIDYWTVEKYIVGHVWKLKGSNFGNKGIFDVIEGQTVKFSIGEPIISFPAASKVGSTYRFSHHLRGRLSETIEITQNGSRPEAPLLQIRNADDSYQKTISFEYG